MKKMAIVFGLVGCLVALAAVGYFVWWNLQYQVVEIQEYHDPEESPNSETYTVERTEYRAPTNMTSIALTDDRLADKTPKFDEALVDSREFEGWQINKSAAVIKLDCPLIKPDRDSRMLRVHASYAEAIQAAKAGHYEMLPSINLIDGAAKQFDDGLYAAVDLACFQGKMGPGISAPEFIQLLFQKIARETRARSFLAGALKLAEVEVELSEKEIRWRDQFLSDFHADQATSKPIGFYTWSDELGRVYRFFRYLQRIFDRDLAIPEQIAAVLKDSAELDQQYRGFLDFYGRLTNPSKVAPLLAFYQEGRAPSRVAVLPPSTSRENELFERLFAEQPIPASTQLMKLLMSQIRSGKVDLRPRENSGWYDHQIFALETMLLPERSAEREKLLLTRRYKKRLLEAFQAIMTKRRETHVRQLATGEAKSEAPPRKMSVRLRIEPNPTFYLRTARAYDFLLNFLAAVDRDGVLGEIEGLRETGTRGQKLDLELKSVRDRFYGFYLISCEDLGLKPDLIKDERVDSKVAVDTAMEWLKDWETNPDLDCDTRVSIPVFVSLNPLETVIWGTFGVRLAKLEVTYARPPSIRPNETGEWQVVEGYRLEGKNYVIAVDDFAEFRLAGRQSLTRREFRTVLDSSQTKQQAIEKLSNR